MDKAWQYCVAGLLLLIISCDACTWGNMVWNAWGRCSRSCGGGTRRRTGESCFWHKDDSQTEDCNEFCHNNGHYYSGGCHCSAWRSGRCCDGCRDTHIAHCKHGRYDCGGNPDNIRCTECEDPYYSGGYGHGCLVPTCFGDNCGGASRCHWTPWESWGSCSRTCGGGTRSRQRGLCCDTDWLKTPGLCTQKCGKTDAGYSGTGQCGNTCFNGGYIQGSPYRHCACPDIYYGSCCKTICPDIAHCTKRHCTSRYNVECSECEDNRVFYKLTHSNTRCERKCAWNNHYCWPGTCGEDLTKNCHCDTGFRRVSNGDSETTCQLESTNAPTIQTCETSFVSSRGDKKSALRTSSSTACKYLTDVYGNFQTSTLEFDLLAEFTVDIKLTPPKFIEESNFGVTDTTAYLVRRPISGPDVHLGTNKLLIDSNHSASVTRTTSIEKNVTLSSSTYHLNDGQRLCVTYEALGGGFLKSRNLTTNTVSSPVSYQKTKTLKEICYRFDSSPPKHCLESRTCTKEPLNVEKRITRSGIIPLTFIGWSDPIPSGGTRTHASGIETYQITVNEVIPSNGTLIVNTKNIFTEKFSSSDTSATLNLTSSTPKLYSITLEVKDVADNVKQGRRFVLYDNSSSILPRATKPFMVTSASVKTNRTWQTHHNSICFDWKDHFYNDFYFNNQLFNPIKHDGNIRGVYEQNNGILPVSGTPNVYGIVKYMFSSSLNYGTLKTEIPVPNFQNQSYCQNFHVNDGQTYTLNIRAVDIASNSYSENRTVHIDRSVPHINNIWLVKNGYRRLFVHDTKDLSTMQLYFEALDPHSGILNVEWSFGVTDAGTELAKGMLPGGAIKKSDCSNQTSLCYCPDVGLCEIYKYTVPLNKLVEAGKHQGNHNRNYFFTLKVTNNALLTNIEHVDILVDDSPPETGVVLEGPVDSPDIDYTSDTTILVHWHGFIDHESGIKMYRVGLADRCLGKMELDNTHNATDILEYREVLFTETSVQLAANFTGKRFVTVVALNNAMDVSDAVCSDGITKDDSPPELRNVTMEHSRWSETIICREGQTWLMHSSVSKIKLHATAACTDRCTNSTVIHPFAHALPTVDVKSKDEEVSNFMCDRLPEYSPDTIIYIPNDHINIHWDIEEASSQMEDFYVGFGVDGSSPSIVGYQSTNRKTFFRRNHEGLGSDTLFYVFIKAVNKAGLESVTAIGPVLIDETPPRVKSVPQVDVQNKYIVVGWENDTFYDEEQPSQINQIFFQIAHDQKTVTPLLEWRLGESKSCSSFSGGCFMYPVRRLQRQDTDLGLEFYISLYVHNNAGHFIKLDTETFRLPSRYTPGHAVIHDTDPDDTSFLAHQTDVNVHFKEHTLCARWSGFKHHENLTFEFGVGTRNSSDDAIPFYPINGTTSACTTSMALQSGIKYFVLIRSTCSGGQTVSSSNGVTIMNPQILQHLDIRLGRNCLRSAPVYDHAVLINGKNASITVNNTLNIGMQYLATISNYSMKNLTLNSADALVHFSNYIEPQFSFSIVPLVEYPVLEFVQAVPTHNAHLILKLFACMQSKYHNSQSSVSVNWHYKHSDIPAMKYESAIIGSTCNTFSNSSCLEYVTAFKAADTNESTTFTDLRLQPNKDYSVAVRPCTEHECMEMGLSETFQLDIYPPTGVIEKAQLNVAPNKDCFDFSLAWNKFEAASGVQFYQWTISTDSDASHLLLKWQTMAGSNITKFKHNECIALPVHAHASLFGCVRAYSGVGRLGVACVGLKVQTIRGYRWDAVYDVDMSGDSWSDIKEILHSSDAGGKYGILHNSEMDFGTSSSKIAGVIMHATERNITWSLMTSQHTPDKCSSDKDCETSLVTDTGFGMFDQVAIQPNTFYYICAYSNITIIEREWFTDTLGELDACSNGFILDNKPPTKGNVTVSNTDGYLVDLSHVYVSWTSFSDNVNATVLGYPDGIKSYSYSVGSRPGGDDVRTLTGVGLAHSAVIKGLEIPDGRVMFVSVNATDHAGLSTLAVSQELVIDTSPPTAGNVAIDGDNNGETYVITDVITLQLTGFSDPHSGVHHFEVGVGSQPDITDIVPATVYHDTYFQLRLYGAHLYDGHRYHIIVKATNRAGLSSNFVTHSFVVDRSPPTGGHVIDGHWNNEKDVDFQRDVGQISGHWKGFIDPHSGIYYYRVCLGSRPYQSDVKPMADVGLQTDIVWSGSFVPGEKYYLTVDACNGGGLCVTRCSDGIILDNSPPIHGLVMVGSDTSHRRYQPRNSSVHIQWAGFEDPHSGIDHFKACIGSAPGACDLQPYFECLLQSNVIRTGLNLPLNTQLYATVKAFNGAGMFVTQTSDAFSVDTTPPVILNKPRFILDYNAISGATAQWEKSVLRLEWEFEDNDSPIIRHIVTLTTHHEGHTPVEHVEMGPENTLTLNLDGHNWLHVGDKYSAVVTSCNEAGLCSTSRSPDMLIDSTPPHVGGFKPPMAWNNFIDSAGRTRSSISLTWYGFVDQESGIDSFFLTVGTSYSGQELTDGVISITNNDTSHNEWSFSIELKEKIQPDDLIILTTWARNGAGLNSSVARISVNALSMSNSNHNVSAQHGTLEIEKHSCDVHFCNKDCTCAVIGQPCADVRINASCDVINATEIQMRNLPTIQVFVGLPAHRQNITVSSACLSGHWLLLPSVSNISVQRYEWSIGLENQPIGDGIFDLQNERPWNDIGLRNEFVHCLAVNHTLEHDSSYVVYVRVWYGNNIYAVFNSSPVKVDQTAPQARRGRFVKESDVACSVDLDFINWNDTITACWNGVFSEQQGKILYFTVQLGTADKADDVTPVTNVGLQTSITLTNITLVHGTRYFFTVTSYNNVGLHSSLTSDGFVVDTDSPVAGVIFNTDSHMDERYQSSNTTFSLSWHGFVDHYSGIKSYQISVADESNLTSPDLNFTDVGLRTDFTFTGLNLEHGKTYYGLVKAFDAAGHVSNTSVSRGKTIDVTAPFGFVCESYHMVRSSNKTEVDQFEDRIINLKQNLSQNTLYRLDGFLTSSQHQPIKLSIGRFHMHLPSVLNHNGTQQFQYSFISSLSDTTNVTLTVPFAQNMTMTASLYACDRMAPDNASPIRVQQIGASLLAVNILVLETESPIVKTLVGAGTTAGGFQIRPLSPIHSGNHGVIRANVPHATPIFVTAIVENEAGIRSIFHSTPITMDHTSPQVDDILVTERAADALSESGKVIVNTTWKVQDPESGLKSCYCALGSRAGSTDVADVWLTEQLTTCQSEPIQIAHGSTIFVTVRCVNNVELARTKTSHPVIISTKRPSSDKAALSFVHLDKESARHLSSSEGLGFTDADNVHVYIQSNQTCAQLEWSGFDDVSGIDHYEYRLLQSNLPIVDWTAADRHTMSTILGIHMTSGSIVSAEVRAINSGGHVSDVARAKLLVQSREPKLTGDPVKTSVSGQLLHLDWTPVFDTNRNMPVTYSLTIGSLPGFSDVTDVQHVTDRVYDVTLPRSTLVTETVNEIFIAVTCSYSTGLYSTYSTSYKLDIN